MDFMTRRVGFGLALLCACLAGPPAAAATLKVDYKITLSGLAIGDVDFTGVFDGDRYDMNVKGQLTGLAGAVSGGSQGGASAAGTVAGSRLVPSGFSAVGRAGSNERTVQMAVSSGNVTAIAINPPFEPQPDRVPVSDAQKRGIVDPLSGLVAIAANRARPQEAANCNRTIPVFDGTQRFNIVLSFNETRLVRKAGFTGNVLVCDIRYVPIAGHRTQRPSVRFMAENRDMSVWLAPVEGTRFLVPIRVSVRTMLGTTLVEAERWRVQ